MKAAKIIWSILEEQSGHWEKGNRKGFKPDQKQIREHYHKTGKQQQLQWLPSKHSILNS